MKKKSSKKIQTKKVPTSVRIDLTGHQYGRLTVLGFAGYRHTALMWKCQCECGSVSDYYRNNLRSGTSTQCIDCRHEDFGERSTTHNMHRTPEYRAWERVRKSDNCCQRWSKFENFYEDLGDRPSDEHHISRSVASRGWKPSNVDWVHRDEVQTQKSNSRMIRFRGKNQTLTAWAEEIGISPASLRYRLKNGWTVKEALTTESLR